MPLWLWLLDSLALIVAILAVTIAWLVMRRRVLIRRSGAAFDVSVNRDARSEARGWTVGFAIYRGAELHWFRTFSGSLRPRYRFARNTFEVGQRREPTGSEIHVLHADHVVVPVSDPSGVAQIALSGSALTGLLSWLESAPPGERVNNVL